MNAELEKWLQDNAEWSDYLDSMPVITVEAIRELLAGKVLVPVDALNAVMGVAGVALVYQPFGTKDRQHFDTLIQIAASQEPK
jgi:hypothetical protein